MANGVHATFKQSCRHFADNLNPSLEDSEPLTLGTALLEFRYIEVTVTVSLN